jgi:hypothetical protein
VHLGRSRAEGAEHGLATTGLLEWRAGRASHCSMRCVRMLLRASSDAHAFALGGPQGECCPPSRAARKARPSSAPSKRKRVGKL